MPDASAERAFERIRDHVLLPFAGPLDEADHRLAGRLGIDLFTDLVDGDPGRLAAG